MQRLLALGLFLAVLTGLEAATTTVVPGFTSVGQAVSTLPELSVLNTQVQKISLATQLNSAEFVGTVFAPINAGLQPLVDALGGDLSSLGSSAQINDIFQTSVLSTKLTLDQLQNGQQLTASNGNTVTVTISTVNGGKVYYINKARITTANILAGKAIIHEVRPILLPPTYQSMMESLGYTDTSTVQPTGLYANPTVTIPDPSPSPSPAASPSPSPSVNPSPSPNFDPAPSTGGSTPTASPPVDTGSSGGSSASSPSPSPSPAVSSPAPSSGNSGSSSGSSTGGSAGSGSSTSTGSSGSSTSTGTSSGSGTTTTTTTTGTTTTTTIPTTTTSNSAVTTEAGVMADPDLGLDISAGHSAVLATALLAVPMLVAAML